MRLGQTSAIHLTSQFIASIAGFVATLYIARELGSSVLGTYSLFIAVIIWSKTITGMGIKEAIKKRLSEVHGDAKDVSAGIIIQSLAYILASGIALALAEPLNNYLRFDGTILLILTLGLTLAFSLVTTILEGEQKVHISALLMTLDRVVRSAVQLTVIFVGVLGGGLIGLIWGYLAGIAVAAAVGIMFVSISLTRPTYSHFHRIFGFARYAWLSGIEGRSFSSLDTVILGLFVVPSFIGYYEVAWNLASILAVFGTSLSTTLFPVLSELSSNDAEEKASSLINEALAYTGLFLFPGFVGTILIGDRILAIYGAEFQQASTILVILIVARLIYAYEAQFVSALNAINHPDAAFKVNVLFIITNIVMNVTLVYLYGWYGAAIATASAAGVCLLFAYQKLQNIIEFTVPIEEMVRQGIAAMTMGGFILLLEPFVGQLNYSPFIGTIFLVISGAAFYFLVLVIMSNRFRTTVKDNLLRQ